MKLVILRIESCSVHDGNETCEWLKIYYFPFLIVHLITDYVGVHKIFVFQRERVLRNIKYIFEVKRTIYLDEIWMVWQLEIRVYRNQNVQITLIHTKYTYAMLLLLQHIHTPNSSHIDPWSGPIGVTFWCSRYPLASLFYMTGPLFSCLSYFYGLHAFVQSRNNFK